MSRRVAGRAADGSVLRHAKRAPDPAEVQRILRQAARLEPSIALGLLATVPAVANVPGIWTAAANLQAGAGGRLDKPANNALNDVIRTSGEKWIAEDQKAFAAAATELRAHLDAFRTNVQWAASHVDGIGDGFAVYWGAAAGIARTTYLRLLRLQALALVPQTRVAARVAMRATAARANAALAAAGGRLQAFLGSTLSAVAAYSGGTAALQLRFMRPDGAAAIDFGRAAVDPSKAGTFAEPPASGLPAATGTFGWRVRTPDGDMDLDDVVRNQP
ncbi:hypothetical protein ACU635_48640 [[Actinomadura] parvosata]|uniref:hypothetical protein n=1 Tax=[Actinomadura] parvosata TaxID=1955412 RepID=UPI00406BF673